MSFIREKIRKKPIFSHAISANIPKFYLFSFAWMFVLMFTVNVVFLRENGIPVSQITILDVFWAVAAFALEVPTGALADRWSRKYMLVLSSLFASLGLLTYSLSRTFLLFALATIFMAMRNSFSSGTANALLFDTLKNIGKEDDFEKILGRVKLLGIISVSLAGIFGAYLASLNIRLPFVISIFTSLVAALIALTFEEPRIHTSTEEVKIFEHIKQAGKYFLTHPVIKFLFLYLIFMDIAISYLDEYDQLYLTEISFPLSFFGVWIGARRCLSGFGGLFAEKLKNKSSAHLKSIALLAMLVSLVVVSAGNKYAGLVAFLLIFLIWGVSEVLISGELHSQVESYRRATIESLIVFFGVIIDIPARLGFGYISEAFGIRTGYLYVMTLLLLYSPYFFTKKSVLLILKSRAKNSGGASEARRANKKKFDIFRKGSAR